MEKKSLPALDAGFKKAFAQYKKDAAPLIGVSIVFNIILMLVGVGGAIAVFGPAAYVIFSGGAGEDLGNIAAGGMIAAVFGILFVLLSLYLSGASAGAFNKIILTEKKVGFDEAVKYGFKNGIQLSIVLLLLAILVMGSTLLLVIPGLVLGLYLSFALFAAVDDNLKAKESIIRSFKLVQGYFWPVLGRFILLYFAVNIPIWIIQAIFNSSESVQLILGGAGLVMLYSFVFAGPFYMVYLGQLYKSLKSAHSSDKPKLTNGERHFLFTIPVLGYILLIGGIVLAVLAS